MDVQINALQPEEAKEICLWRYEGVYAFYNLEADAETLDELLDGTYYSVRGGEGELIGFCCFGASAQVPSARSLGMYEGEGVLDIGLGMKPERTGQGHGKGFMSACLDFACATFRPNRLRLSVAAFNRRAVQLYSNAGFEIRGSFDSKGTEFWVMERQAHFVCHGLTVPVKQG